LINFSSSDHFETHVRQRGLSRDGPLLVRKYSTPRHAALRDFDPANDRSGSKRETVSCGRMSSFGQLRTSRRL